MTVRLVDRRPDLGAAELLARLAPPARFAGARFETYLPDPGHPSQAAARGDLERFAASVAGAGAAPAPRRRLFRRAAPASPLEGRPARYLDGGYGVGKTHLLAAAWHAVQPAPAAFLSFGELTALVGFLGMEGAIEAFSHFRLLCIDEFELDDVANTLMLVSFLRAVIAAGVAVAATSNAIPDRLGEGRFNAEDFTREIAAIAAHFEALRIDGEDYRRRGGLVVDPMDDARLDAFVAAAARAGARTSVDDTAELLDHLRRVPPAQLNPLLDGLDTVVLRDVHPITNQGTALLFVTFIDEVYDAGVTLAASGCRVAELFDGSFRHGGFRKKYGRCESRLSALLAESASA
jgi:cell division protein ZapE